LNIVSNVQRRSGILVAYCTFVFREVGEFPISGELNSLLPAIIIGSKAKGQTSGEWNDGVECVQWMHYGAHCCSGDTSEFAMGQEGKEKDKEFLFLDTLGDLAEVYLTRVYMDRHTVNACHTIWRFIKS
jgi:hypothetical protein